MMRGLILLSLLSSFFWPAGAWAHHRDKLLDLIPPVCGQAAFDSPTAGAIIKTGTLACALPLVRQRSLATPIAVNNALAVAAQARSYEMAKCGLGPSACGHTATYQPTKTNYITDSNCDSVAETYRSFLPTKSVRAMVSELLHSDRSIRLLRQGRWRDFGVDIRRYNYRFYVVIIFGRSCSDRSSAPSYQPGPVNLAPAAEDNLSSEKANGTFKYHVVYAWPNDRPDRFSLLREQINNNALLASVLPLPLSEKQRSIRLDVGTADNSEAVDITTAALPYSSAQLSGEEGYFLLHDFLAKSWNWSNSSGGRYKNLLVYLDLADNGGTCGRANIGFSRTRDPLKAYYNNHFQIAVVYLDVSDPAGGRFCDARTARHEIGHNLGALGDAAPHAFDGMHCDDALEDTMCYSGWIDEANVLHQTPRRLPAYASQANGGEFWDFGHDDYWDPVGGQLPWWTTNLSRFVCPDAVCTPDGSDMIGF